MKISMEEVGRAIQTQTTGRTMVTAPREVGVPESRTQPAATLEITGRAQEIQRATQAVNRLPDVREEMVAELKARIESGNYNVSGEDVADLIIRRSYADSIR